MKSKLSILLVTVAMIIAMIAFDVNDACAFAGAHSFVLWCDAYTGCTCTGCNVCFDVQADVDSCASACTCKNAPEGPTYFYCYAWAYRHGKCGGKVEAEVAWGDYGYGKGEKLADTVIIKDTVDCQITHISGNNYELNTKGEMKLFPAAAAGGSWVHLDVSVYEGGNEDNRPFWGRIILAPSGPFAEGDYDASEFSDSVVAGTLLVSFDVYDTLGYTGITDSLALHVRTLDRATNVPTTTQWGLIILVALLIASTVFVMLRRRKAVVRA